MILMHFFRTRPYYWYVVVKSSGRSCYHSSTLHSLNGMCWITQLLQYDSKVLLSLYYPHVLPSWAHTELTAGIGMSCLNRNLGLWIWEKEGFNILATRCRAKSLHIKVEHMASLFLSSTTRCFMRSQVFLLWRVNSFALLLLEDDFNLQTRTWSRSF